MSERKVDDRTNASSFQCVSEVVQELCMMRNLSQLKNLISKSLSSNVAARTITSKIKRGFQSKDGGEAKCFAPSQEKRERLNLPCALGTSAGQVIHSNFCEV